jgi:hypothetical protein
VLIRQFTGGLQKGTGNFRLIPGEGDDGDQWQFTLRHFKKVSDAGEY